MSSRYRPRNTGPFSCHDAPYQDQINHVCSATVFDPWEKSGWRTRLELGLDSYVVPDNAGPPVLQVKCAAQPR